MEKRFRILPKLSLTPSKAQEGVYRVRVGKLAAHDWLEAGEAMRGTSLSPRRGKLGLFRGAHRIQPTETYLLQDKTNHLSNTNESSSPKDHHPRNHPRLTKPLDLVKSNRSMSAGKAAARGKAIQRTVSIVIEGKQEEREALMHTLSRLILGEEGGEDLLFEFVQESSIHGEELNFVELDSRLLTEEVTPDESIIQI